jgi:hypothetical protein
MLFQNSDPVLCWDFGSLKANPRVNCFLPTFMQRRQWRAMLDSQVEGETSADDSDERR